MSVSITTSSHIPRLAADQGYKLGSFCRSSPLYTTNAVWLAFQDGMNVLYRYAGRSGADSSLIAKANLRLLHNTLLNEPSYREKLAVAENNRPKNGSPTRYNLLNSEKLNADLISLQPGCHINTPNSDPYSYMYLVIYGKVTVNYSLDFSNENKVFTQQKSWWQRLRHSSNENILKQGDVILTGLSECNEKTVSAIDQQVILLRIALSDFNQHNNQ